MTATELAQQISADIKCWIGASSTERAQAVLDWCQANGVDTSSITARPLAAAMGKFPYWKQGPSDYLDMVNSIAAFLASR